MSRISIASFILISFSLWLGGCPILPPSEHTAERSQTDASNRETNPTEVTSPEPTKEALVSKNPLENMEQPALIKDTFAFTEGPLWDKNNKRLLFSDVFKNVIYELNLPSMTKEFLKPSQFSNGLAFDAKGLLLIAERVNRRITRMGKDGKVVPLIEKYQGKKFHGPNDLTVHRSGRVYFSDPPYALPEASREIDFNGIYMVSAKGDKVVALWKGGKTSRPNGIILSPDEKRLYFADAAAGVIWVATVKADGTIEEPKELTKTSPTPDGMTIDQYENLYVATREGIEVFAKNGQKWGTIKIPLQPSNCTFGGVDRKTLFITARGSLFQIPNMLYAGSH